MTTWQELHDAITQLKVATERDDPKEAVTSMANLLFPIVAAQERQAKALEDIAEHLSRISVRLAQ